MNDELERAWKEAVVVSAKVLCPPILSSIPDRLPEMDENWTFDTCSGLYAKEGA
jgi:hypothetical protein